MKVSDKIRISYANLLRLTDHFEYILGLKKVKDLKKLLSYADSTTLVHAFAIHDYATKHKSAIKKLVKSKGLEDAFFEVAKDVIGRRESLDNILDAESILQEVQTTIQRQRIILKDITYVEKDEFKHLQDWGLEHSTKKDRIHISEFVHKLQKKIHWTDRKNLNDLKYLAIVENEPDHLLRDVHLYIIYLINLKKQYMRLCSIFDEQEKSLKSKQKSLKSLKKEPFATPLFFRHAREALEKSKNFNSQILEESKDLQILVRTLKEMKLHIPNIERHKVKSPPFLKVIGHPVQLENHPETHPSLISIPQLCNHFGSKSLLFGAVGHVLLHHTTDMHFSVTASTIRNYPGSPGTFVIRKDKVFAVVEDKNDKVLLEKRMAMSPEDYLHMNKKLSFKMKSLKLEDGDEILVPPGYHFRFQSSTK